MIVKKQSDHVILTNPLCGEIREILCGSDNGPLNIAVVENIGKTTAHYHEGFEEIYFVLNGSLTLQLYDPKTGRVWDQTLGRQDEIERKYELCVIPKGVHHKVIEASPQNVPCVVCTPPFDLADEHKSERL